VPRERDDGSHGTLIGVVLAIAVIAGGAALVAPAFTRRDRHCHMTKCMSNLKQIGIALHVYAMDHDGEFPDSLSLLVPRYVSDPSIFVCPDARANGIPGTLHYGYVSGLSESMPPTFVLAYDEVRNHGGQGANAAFIDGHCEWMTLDELAKQIARTQMEATKRRHRRAATRREGRDP